MQILPNGLNALAAFNQFVVYKLVPSATRVGKTDKLPVDYRTGNLPNSGAGGSAIWCDVHTAIERAATYGDTYGVGFFFTEADPLWFIDIDNCVTETLAWSDLARSLLHVFNGAYVEVSQSGRGLHIIGSGVVPPHACKNTAYGLELYHADRFVALTGTHASGDARTDMSHILPWLVDTYFKPSTSVAMAWTDEPDAEWSGNTNDDELIARALRSGSAANVFGKRATFADLWEADVNALATAFPDDERDYDASSADAALAQHLAFWTGKNCERMLTLMQRSALVREKWNRDDYMQRTILGACARQIDVLQDKRPVMGQVEYDTPDGKPAVGESFLSGDKQAALFKGCVYVTTQHTVLVEGGMLLKPEQFRVKYGGYSFNMDSAGLRVSRNAWEAFSESQVYIKPSADMSCFRPDLPAGTIIHRDGGSAVNTYWEVKTSRIVGDPSPFLNHLSKVYPNPNDRAILLAFMAAVVQHKGKKFQWTPLLQGVEGNGKTLFTRCVAFAVGDRYTHFAKASQIAKNFNGWMANKIFIAVEDIYVADSQREVIEELKPMITGERIEVERKGVDQITMDVCCNFILNSNHKDGIRKTANDRRFAQFYSAQQTKDDLARDGMTGSYFPDLYDWLKHEQGYEIVNEYLHTYVIPDELNPANGHIAPITSSTNEALVYGLGRIEQEVLEAVERSDTGFRGGWISSMALDQLLERIGSARMLAPNKRREILLNLGYDYHPSLNAGRVNTTVLPDGGKPRLYIHKTNTTLRTLLEPIDVARVYSMSQNIC